jgi:sugar O-acyltransferase (sialic acid O-acetyltransferase NeuD family)|nr:acetyltransferase [uncultured bacterium]|tara:strand:+ start:1832 stop:2419 length:588 start_codon:yes stop_codon:yes gene_type:complete
MIKIKPNLVLIGGGGHCLSVIDVIENGNEFNILGILDSNIKENDLLGHRVLGGDDLISELVSENTYFLITVGQIKSYSTRQNIAKILAENNAKLATVISTIAYVSKHAHVKEGSIIMNHAVVNANSKIGKNCIINTMSNIEHGVIIGDFCHISTCAVVNGESSIGKGSFIGSNATISNNITINDNSIISAGKFIR